MGEGAIQNAGGRRSRRERAAHYLGLLWKIAPQVPFITAGVIGLAGALVFAATVEERYAS